MSKSYRLAVVLPRYGEQLGGGAETLVKSLIEESLSRSGLIESVEVWTTCALDHRTWENALPEGETLEGGISVSRFRVEERDLEVFLQAEFAIRDGRPLSTEQQLDWMANSVNSFGLYEHIEQNHHRVEFILFAPYLFATSFWGSMICPDKSVIFPCLHDEGYAYQPIFQAMFQRAKGLIFNTEAERELAREIYGFENLEEKSKVVGMGFEFPKDDNCLEMEVIKGSPYLLYSGRKEQGKNLDLLIEYFSRWKRSCSEQFPELRLLMIGAGEINFLEELPDGVHDLGFVSEEEKRALFNGALALCQPSQNESFSIVMMEAWIEKCPVIVHGECAVTRENVVNSSGGLFFANFEEFSHVVEKLILEPALAETFGESGYEYVKEVYNWDRVIERFQSGLDLFSGLALPEAASGNSRVREQLTGVKVV